MEKVTHFILDGSDEDASKYVDELIKQLEKGEKSRKDEEIEQHKT